MKDPRKKIIKLLLSFGFEHEGLYQNERYCTKSPFQSHFARENWNFNPNTGKFSINIYSLSGSYSKVKQLPTLRTNSQRKLRELFKELKWLKELWIKTMDNEYADKYIKAWKKEDKMREDFD